jgi:hypothetical protein
MAMVQVMEMKTEKSTSTLTLRWTQPANAAKAKVKENARPWCLSRLSNAG